MSKRRKKKTDERRNTHIQEEEEDRLKKEWEIRQQKMNIDVLPYNMNRKRKEKIDFCFRYHRVHIEMMEFMTNIGDFKYIMIAFDQPYE